MITTNNKDKFIEEVKKILEEHESRNPEQGWREVLFTQTDEDYGYVGWFKRPSTRLVQDLNKKYKTDSIGWSENLCKQCLLFPARDKFDEVSQYLPGMILKISSELLEWAGFNSEVDLSKKKLTDY